MDIARSRCCYANHLIDFLEEPASEWVAKMKRAFATSLVLPLGTSQVRAWLDCFDVLMDQLPTIAQTHPNFDIVEREWC